MRGDWVERDRPPRLERRYQFSDYSMLRDFLDRAAELSKREGLYPDLSFGRDYLNVTIHAPADGDRLTEQEHRFARELEMLFAPPQSGD